MVRLLLTAIAAGLLAGLIMTIVQQWKVVPLIIEAESYEAVTGHSHDENSTVETASAGHDDHEHGHILFGLSRFGGTLLANLVTGAGYGLLLGGVIAVAGVQISVQMGLLVGALAWLAVQLLPALGLPPELPGFPTGDLQARQIWWVATVVLSATGLALIAVRGDRLSVAVGLVLIAAPHLYGAPVPATDESPLPATLAADYVVASLVSTLVFWLVLGWALAMIDALARKRLS
jgi:cobalt transporter subunit CbtA